MSLVLDTFSAEGLSSEALLAGSGISVADLSRAEIRITTHQEMQVCANAVALRGEIGLELGRRTLRSCRAGSVAHRQDPARRVLAVWRSR